MTELAKSDIFFVITGGAVILIALVVLIALFYVLRILRDVKDISGNVRAGTNILKKDVRASYRSIKKNSKSFISFIYPNKKKKGTNTKNK